MIKFPEQPPLRQFSNLSSSYYDNEPIATAMSSIPIVGSIIADDRKDRFKRLADNYNITAVTANTLLKDQYNEISTLRKKLQSLYTKTNNLNEEVCDLTQIIQQKDIEIAKKDQINIKNAKAIASYEKASDALKLEQQQSYHNTQSQNKKMQQNNSGFAARIKSMLGLHTLFNRKTNEV